MTTAAVRRIAVSISNAKPICCLKNMSARKPDLANFVKKLKSKIGEAGVIKCMDNAQRMLENKDIDLNKIIGTSDMKKVCDLKGNPLLLFVNSWSVGMTLDRNKGLELSEFGTAE